MVIGVKVFQRFVAPLTSLSNLSLDLEDTVVTEVYVLVCLFGGWGLCLWYFLLKVRTEDLKGKP